MHGVDHHRVEAIAAFAESVADRVEIPAAM